MINATIVLEGGATRGVFTSGVLDYLMEQDTYFSDVIGASAGACNAVDYVSRQPGRTRDCMIPNTKDMKYINGVKDTIREKSLMNMDLIFDKYPNELTPFDFDTYFQSEMHCELVLKICRASISMRLVTPMVNIDGVPYLDGGLADSVPIRRAQKLGNEKIIVILTRNQGYRKKVISPAVQKLYRQAYKSYPNAVRTIFRRSFIYNKTMNYLDQLEKRGEIYVLRPHVKPVSRLEQHPDVLHAFYELGYHLMERDFDKMSEFLGK